MFSYVKLKNIYAYVFGIDLKSFNMLFTKTRYSKKLFFIVILYLGVFRFTGKTGFASIATLPIMESPSPTCDFGNVKKRCKVCRRRCREAT